MPSLSDAYAIVESDEHRHRLITLVQSQAPLDQVAFATNRSFGTRPDPKGNQRQGPRPHCNHCKEFGHWTERCFILHPELKQKYAKGRTSGPPRTVVVAEISPTLVPATTTTVSPLDLLQAQIGKLQSQIGILANHSSPATSSLSAQESTGTPTALVARTETPTWILDSGANDHMTGELSALTSNIISVDQSVLIADGSSSTISHKGDVQLTPHILLSSVCHIPKLAFNLLSVSRLAKSLNCAVIFLPHKCLLQDLHSRKIFGTGYESKWVILLWGSSLTFIYRSSSCYLTHFGLFFSCF